MARPPTLALLAGLATGCPLLSGELPDKKRSYAGQWEGENMRLHIAPSGEIDYERRRGSSQVTVTGPITQFDGDDFVVGFWFFETRFDVTQPPHLEGDTWWMTVDGVALSRPASTP